MSLRQSLHMASATLLSRLFGMLRDVGLAYVLGSGPQADAFFLAFRIPNFFRRLFAEGSFSQAFVPVMQEYRLQKPGELSSFLAQVGVHLALYLGGIVLIGVFGASWFIRLYAPGFVAFPSQFELASSLLSALFPFLLIVSVLAFLSAVANAWGHFFVPACMPILLNLGILGALVSMVLGVADIHSLAWGINLSALAQVGLISWFLYVQAQKGKAPKFSLQWPRRNPGVSRVLLLMVPTLFSVSAVQVNLLIGMQLASFLEHGSISWLSYADRLMSLPVGVIGVAIGSVVLPRLSFDQAEGDRKAFEHSLSWGLQATLFFGLPSAVVAYMASDQLVYLLFGYAKTSLYDVRMISLALGAYAIGIPWMMVLKVQTAALFSLQKSRLVLYAALVSVAVNILASLALFRVLAHQGLALATTLGALAQVLVMSWSLWRLGIRLDKLFTRGILQLISSAAVSLFVAWALLYYWPLLPHLATELAPSVWMRLLWVALMGTLVMGVFVGGLRLLRFPLGALKG